MTTTNPSFSIESVISTMNKHKHDKKFMLENRRFHMNAILTLIAERGPICNICKNEASHFGISKYGNLVLYFSEKSKFKDIKEVCMTLDHIIPVSKGGANELSNIQLACTDCNITKGHKIIYDKELINWINKLTYKSYIRIFSSIYYTSVNIHKWKDHENRICLATKNTFKNEEFDFCAFQAAFDEVTEEMNEKIISVKYKKLGNRKKLAVNLCKLQVNFI
ncbi:MAG: HNH endonuclease [Nitrososphaeraceae archaeon]